LGRGGKKKKGTFSNGEEQKAETAGEGGLHPLTTQKEKKKLGGPQGASRPLSRVVALVRTKSPEAGGGASCPNMKKRKGPTTRGVNTAEPKGDHGVYR